MAKKVHRFWCHAQRHNDALSFWWTNEIGSYVCEALSKRFCRGIASYSLIFHMEFAAICWKLRQFANWNLNYASRWICILNELTKTITGHQPKTVYIDLLMRWANTETYCELSLKSGKIRNNENQKNNL